jgi:hypothetical protein
MRTGEGKLTSVLMDSENENIGNGGKNPIQVLNALELCSNFFHLQGEGKGNWCSTLGDFVLKMLSKEI